MRLSKLYNEFFESEKSGGIVLIVVTLFSILIANSSWAENYLQIWNFKIAGFSIGHFINDGLMAVFFLMIGMELEREIYNGELSDIKKAAMPIIGALGGMIFPAVIFLVLNSGKPTQSGFGIPMATDIAFAIGILSLLGKKAPISLKVFLTALAVIDDLGAIIIIAFFYSGTISFLHLLVALGVLALLFVFNRLKVYIYSIYIIGGIIAWYFMLKSGVHATITGVLLAFVIPFHKKKDAKYSMSDTMLHSLHIPVSFIILPLFAMANTGITFGNGLQQGLFSPASMGILLGLIIGKPLGVFIFSFISSRLGWCSLPEQLRWKHIAGAGLLAGIGFTMAIFITLLAFKDDLLINQGKIAILLSSLISGIAGFIMLSVVGKKEKIVGKDM